ncbi:MAG: hypothetical protein K2X08_05840 [Chlamydiales bacterium]|nr:hypothetical protein [Chlamydiales bacterium]
MTELTHQYYINEGYKPLFFNEKTNSGSLSFISSIVGTCLSKGANSLSSLCLWGRLQFLKIKGLLFFSNSTYQGQWRKGKPHGQGMRRFKSGDIYEGQFIKGKITGTGIYKYKNGHTYIGNFLNGRREGQGILIFKNGTSCEGEFKQDKLHGEATLRTSTIAKKVFISNSTITNLNRSDIGDSFFFSLLYGIPDKKTPGHHYNYAAGILADYVVHYFNNDPDSLKIVTPLMKAHQLSSMNSKKKLSKIAKKIQQNRPVLLNYGCKRHAMMLNLVPSQDGQFIDCEIFNSGRGLLKYHERDPKTKKYQTMKIIRIPKAELTKKKLKQLIHYQQFKHVDEAYQAILSLPAAYCIQPIAPVWQAAQKGPNCSLECDFAYLKNKLPLYRKLRNHLFIDSLFARLQQEKASKSQNNSLKEPRVLHKINKDPILKQRLQTLDLSA